MSTKLEQSILATLSYFDIFEYPLTLFEVGKNLVDVEKIPSTPLYERGEIAATMVDIEHVLNGEKFKSIVGKNNGFYFLNRNNVNYLTRQKRYYLADKKFKRAKKIAWLLGKIPFIKMVAVCNSLGYSNVREDSDIDLFVVAAKNRVWAARFLSVILIKFLNLRPREGRVRDTICMSFFVDEDNLNLEKFKIGEDDIYLTFWITQVFPIYDKGGIYERFFEENGWVKKVLPNAKKREVELSRVMQIKSNPPNPLPNRVEDRLCQGGGLNKNSVQSNWLEKFSKKIQLKFMNSKLKEIANKDTRVVVNDGVLKLFAVDRREEYMKKWMETLKEFNTL